MKKILILLFIIPFTAIIFFTSCKKDQPVEDNKINQPPVANAGPDRIIFLPMNTLSLNGSGSSDPDNNIISYEWSKFSGPSPFNIVNANKVTTQVTGLVEGVYNFELKVSDAKGLFS